MKQTKILTLLFAILVGQTVLAQKKLPIIKATSTSVDIKDDNNLRKNAWRIVPEEKLDVYTTSAKKVTFYTDIDSISFKIVPKKQYDFIILDPPAFTKSGSTVKNAIRGYKEINLKAMKLLPRGGYLATCSCSHFMKEELFVKMLQDAAHDANVSLRQIEARQQSPDHPILWQVPETNYLKFYIFQVV